MLSNRLDVPGILVRRGGPAVVTSRSLVLLLVGSFFAAVCNAQTSNVAPVGQSATGPEPFPGRTEIRETGPPILYVPDDEGETYLPVVDMPISTFERLYRISEGLDRANQPPNYTLRELALDGVAKDTHAELVASFDVETHVDGWVKIPLAMREARLRADSIYDGPGKHVMHATGDGYLLWIYGQPQQTHALSMSFLVPLERNIGIETHLRLSAPYSTNSRLTLRIPSGDWVTEVSDGSILTTTTTNDGESELQVQGLTPRFRIGWREATTEAVTAGKHINVAGVISVDVDRQGTVTSDVELTIDSRQQIVRDIRIRLPAGMRLIGPALNGRASREGEQQGRSVWRITLPQPTTESVVRIRTQSEEALEKELEIAAYEVIGALRQTGTVSVASDADWKLRFAEGDSVARVQNTRVSPRAIAKFEYFQQPCSLVMRVSRKATRVIVEPIYSVDIREGRVFLDAHLKYKVRSAKATVARIDLEGWEIDEIATENGVRLDDVAFEDAEPIEIPLDSNTASEFALHIQASRQFLLADGVTPLDVKLPTVDADVVTPSTVIVVSAQHLAVQPRVEETADFVLSSMPPDLDDRVRASSKSPLCFRLRSDSLNPSLRLEVARLPQSIAFRVDVDLREITPEWASVRQTFHYRIDNVPLTHVLLHLPNSIDQAGVSDITVNDKPVEPSRLPSAVGSSTADSTSYRIELPYPAIGRYEITATYNVARSGRLDDLTVWSMPILRAEGRPSQIRFRAAESLAWTVEVMPSELESKSAWNLRDDASRLAEGWLAATSEPATHVPLLLRQRAAATNVSEALIVDRAWVQTWFTRAARQDRAVYRIVGGPGTIDIEFPEGVDDPRAFLNGQALNKQDMRDGVMKILLSSTDRDFHLLEVVYHLQQRQAPGVSRIRLPRLRGAEMLRQWFWHLVLPGNECVLGVSSEMTSANRWRWNGLGWNRVVQLDQGELERWSGASHQHPVLLGANEYLFGAFGDGDSITIRTATVPFCVLAGSGVVLVFGLLLISVPRLRRPALLLPISLFVLLLALINPAPAAILGQASVVGLVLVVLATGLMWTFGDREQKQPSSEWTLDERRFNGNAHRDGSSRVSTVSNALRLSGSSVRTATRK